MKSWLDHISVGRVYTKKSKKSVALLKIAFKRCSQLIVFIFVDSLNTYEEQLDENLVPELIT